MILLTWFDDTVTWFDDMVDLIWWYFHLISWYFDLTDDTGTRFNDTMTRFDIMILWPDLMRLWPDLMRLLLFYRCPRGDISHRWRAKESEYCGTGDLERDSGEKGDYSQYRSLSDELCHIMYFLHMHSLITYPQWKWPLFQYVDRENIQKSMVPLLHFFWNFTVYFIFTFIEKETFQFPRDKATGHNMG